LLVVVPARRHRFLFVVPPPPWFLHRSYISDPSPPLPIFLLSLVESPVVGLLPWEEELAGFGNDPFLVSGDLGARKLWVPGWVLVVVERQD
jgi:hypothetical protein